MIRPTKRAVGVFAGEIALAIVPALAWPPLWALWLGALLATFVLLAADWFLAPAARALTPTWRIPEKLFVGRPARMAVRIAAGRDEDRAMGRGFGGRARPAAAVHRAQRRRPLQIDGTRAHRRSNAATRPGCSRRR